MGFDGYVDSLYHVIRQRSAQGKVSYENISEFGQDILSRAGISGGFELEKISVRAGGNGPLMVAAQAALGVDVTCLGALGWPAIDSAFDTLAQHVELISVAPAATTVALEFADGKLMLGDTASLERLDWEHIATTAGLQRLRGLAAQAELLALVNWANLAQGTQLWKGFLEEILEKSPSPGRTRRIFFDLADLTRCGIQETLELLALLGRFKSHGEVFLGLNENEARQLGEKLNLTDASLLPLETLGTRLLGSIDVDCMVIHPRHCAVIFQNGKVTTVPGRVVEKVLLSTGGGDNFNAGFCAGLLWGLPAPAAASLAVLVSSLYVAQGASPTRAALVAVLEGSNQGPRTDKGAGK